MVGFAICSIYKHFTVSETASCFTCFFLFKITLFNVVKRKVASFNMGHSFVHIGIGIGVTLRYRLGYRGRILARYSRTFTFIHVHFL